MLKMRLALILGLFLIICLSYQSVQAADAAKAEPEPASEPEPTAEPTGDDETSKRADKSVAQNDNDKSGILTFKEALGTASVERLQMFYMRLEIIIDR